MGRDPAIMAVFTRNSERGISGIWLPAGGVAAIEADLVNKLPIHLISLTKSSINRKTVINSFTITFMKISEIRKLRKVPASLTAGTSIISKIDPILPSVKAQSMVTTVLRKPADNIPSAFLSACNTYHSTKTITKRKIIKEKRLLTIKVMYKV
jgi:hypothetical protein